MYPINCRSLIITTLIFIGSAISCVSPTWKIKNPDEGVIKPTSEIAGVNPTRIVTSTPTISVTPSITHSPSLLPFSSTLQWCDNFNDGYLREDKWILPSSEKDIIFANNSALNLGFNAQNSPTESPKEVRLIADITGKNIKEITYTFMLETFAGEESSGGAGLDIFLENGRDFQIKVGPSTEGKPEIEVYNCPLEHVSCESNYDNYYFPFRGEIQIDTRVPIKVIRRERIEIYMGNRLIADISVEDVPITNLQFSAYADPGSIFNVIIDDVCVLYEER